MKYLTMGVFALILLAATLSFGQTAQWREPCRLDRNERKLISDLTRLREPLRTTLAEAKDCISLSPDTLLIRYENGDIRVFGKSNSSHIPLADKNNQETHLSAVQDTGLEYDVQPFGTNQTNQTNQQYKLFNEITVIWYSAMPSYELTPEKLARIDTLVQEMFDTIPPDKIPPADYEWFGLRGDRYLSIITTTSPLTLDQEVSFYRGYLNYSQYRRSEDVPTDSDKQSAIHRLLDLFETTENLKPYYASLTNVAEEIQRLDPSAYGTFKQMEVILGPMPTTTESNQ